MFVLQTVFFIAVAFGLGCLFGCWLKGRAQSSGRHSGAAAAITHEGAAKTATAGELAAPRPHYEPETSPQPASALSSKPRVDTKVSTPAATVAAEPLPAPTKKTAKPKTAKSAATKPAAGKGVGKATTSKPRAVKAAGATAAKAKTEKAPAAKPKAAKASPVAAAVPDNLKQIKGVGPTIETKLNAAGINSFAQIAAWTKKEQVTFAEQLSFAGRIEREEWVRQAKVLAKGGVTDFSKRVAKGEVASSAGSKPKRGGKK